MTTEKTYGVTCGACRQDVTVTAADATAHGWDMWTVEHIGCTATKVVRSDPTDWSKATDAQVRDMIRQIGGNENVSA